MLAHVLLSREIGALKKMVRSAVVCGVPCVVLWVVLFHVLCGVRLGADLRGAQGLAKFHRRGVSIGVVEVLSIVHTGAGPDISSLTRPAAPHQNSRGRIFGYGVRRPVAALRY